MPVHAEERNRGRRITPADQDWSDDPSSGGGQDEQWEVGERTTELDVSSPSGDPADPGTELSTHVEPGEAPWERERPRRTAAESQDDLWASDPGETGWSGESDSPNSEPLRAEPPWESRRDRSSTPAPPLAPSEEPLMSDPGLTATGGGTELPHWSDPPTGEVPKILINDLDDDADDLAAWKALGARGTRWRDSGDDWEALDGLGDLADVRPTGALDQTRTEHSDLYSFDEDFERIEAQRTGSVPVADFEPDEDFETIPARAAATPAARARHTRSATRRARPDAPDRTDGPGRSGRDELPSRVVVGLGLIILLIICYAIGSKALVVLATVVITAAAAEAYGMLQRSGFRPATLLGLVGTVGVCLGAYWRGIEALPLATVLMFGGAMLWYLLRIVEARPLANVAVTTMTFVWVAVLGSYSSLMLRASHGKGLFLGTVVVVVAADIVAFLVGRWVGNRPMAPGVSPGKTVEGFIGGLVAAVIVGAIIGKELTPWGGMKHGLVLGLIVGLVAPAGDLFESMIKRDLGVKDSGSLLPGHGGLLDRFDALLVVLPAAYYVATLFGIVVVK